MINHLPRAIHIQFVQLFRCPFGSDPFYRMPTHGKKSKKSQDRRSSGCNDTKNPRHSEEAIGERVLILRREAFSSHKHPRNNTRPRKGILQSPQHRVARSPATSPYVSLNKRAGAIRLVKILPASDFYDPIECRLLYVSLNDRPPPKYEALSYVWGDKKPLLEILVNESYFNITGNLWFALLQLRQRSRAGPNRFWIDAICINQNDDAERSAQVSQMRRIYNTAERALVWTGVV